jgi:hypothetical protein
MPEKLSIGRQGGAVEPLREPLRALARRAPGGRQEAGAAGADEVELSSQSPGMMAEAVRVEALAAALAERRYLIPADALSRRLVEEHLAGWELRRN